MGRIGYEIRSNWAAVAVGVISSLIAAAVIASVGRFVSLIDTTTAASAVLVFGALCTIGYQMWLAKRDNDRSTGFAEVAATILAASQKRREGDERDQRDVEDRLNDALNQICSSDKLPHLSAAMIFLPDPKDPEWLVASARSTEKGDSKKKFPIVGNQTAPGAVSKAFTERKSIIVRFDRRGRTDYPFFNQFGVVPTSNYQSFIVTPIFWAMEPVGAVSIESPSRNGIDRNERAMYELLGRCLGSCIREEASDELIDLTQTAVEEAPTSDA